MPAYDVDARGLHLAGAEHHLQVVQRYAPEFEKRWDRFSRPVGYSWRADETYILVNGQWNYLYRAVDKQGRTVDSLLRQDHGIAAT